MTTSAPRRSTRARPRDDAVVATVAPRCFAIAIAAPFLRYAFDADGRFSAGLEPDLGLVLSPTTWNVIPAGAVHHTSRVTSRLALVLTLAL